MNGSSFWAIAAHERGEASRKAAFVLTRKPLHEKIGDDEPEHAIAQKLGAAISGSQ